ncbi:hypothetical protein H2200_003499 [Cladophialophora chaetospira]|uniref:Cation/H+ exchanger transmembrane domain-containing protein n=1 Tax=Cladophialophora chaetospira TaxID=386627 RepID=A0AA38XHL3_9EURO|nr:hypothetical protein H2200_003499 [Cladophialophora chaetospira]
MAPTALAYQEPGIVIILIQASFLLVLNVVGFIFDHVFFCGLVGQVLVGMAWGTPASQMLSRSFEETVTQLGYLGLILIVFEGGLATSAKSLGSSLLLSICVALTGVLLPMALSFSLAAISDATNLQAFAAGASLCSTSLGTTFSLLKTTGMSRSRLGTVLTSAAMLDDVVGLVLVQVISNLGSGHTHISATTIVRPVTVSIAFAITLPVACKFILKPMMREYSRIPGGGAECLFAKLGFVFPFHFVLSTTCLIALATAASYAGTSILFAAYLAGATVSWIDEVSSKAMVPRTQIAAHAPDEQENITNAAAGAHGADRQASANRPSRPSRDLTPPADDATVGATTNHEAESDPLPMPLEMESCSIKMYNDYYAPAVDHILKPFFFASIGFSIPISKMFGARVIWRGLIYAVLMAIGKLCCGFWLIRFAKPSSSSATTGLAPAAQRSEDKSQARKHKRKRPQTSPPRPKSLYPGAILGCAMVARGEIGFLISALAATEDIFAKKELAAAGAEDSDLTSDLYLIVTWAILLCTIVGPLALGFLVKRVKKLQEGRTQEGGNGMKEDPLGIWGVT